jgi:hypothetical protein
VAISNGLLSVEGEVEVEEKLGDFRNETERVSSPVCRVPISSSVGCLNPAAVDGRIGGFECPFYFTQAHNTLARYMDLPLQPIRPVNRNYPKR